ncbi:MAG: O-antigen ligase family protein, partial [Elusimicrobiota bacterium]|nr:O-antigen ligase family protein [Elusimicrobiota bacterium]
VSSFMNNPNVFAGYLVGIIVIAISVAPAGLLPRGLPSVAQNKIKIIPASVFFIAILFTGSLAGLLAAVSGLLFFIYLKKIPVQKKYLIFICVIIAFLLIVKLFEKESFNRVIWWLSAGKMILAKPLSGVGLGAFADAYQKYKLSGLNSIYAHNYFLQTASEIGIFGFAAFVWFLIKIFKFKKNSENIPFFAASFAMLVHGIFDYTLIIPANAILFWIMLGYCSKEEKFIRIFPTQNQKVIFRWISVFLVFAVSYTSVKFFLGSRGTARGKYYISEKRYDTAKTHLVEALKCDDKNPQTYVFLSSVYQQYYKMTDYKSYLYEAELELLKAAEFQKYNPQIYFDLYNIYYLRGDMQNAALWMKKSLDAAPKSVYYKKCYETLLKEIYENTRHK